MDLLDAVPGVAVLQHPIDGVLGHPAIHLDALEWELECPGGLPGALPVVGDPEVGGDQGDVVESVQEERRQRRVLPAAVAQP